MELTEKQLDLLGRRSIVVLATSDSQNKPRAIFVEANQAKGDQIIITDNQMGITRQNLLENKQVFLLVFEEDYHYGIKISGEADYYQEGEYLDFVNRAEGNKGYSPKGAVVITVQDIVEFT